MEKVFKISYYFMIGFIIIFLMLMIGMELKRYYKNSEYNELVLINKTNQLSNIITPITREYKGIKISKKVYKNLLKMSKSAGRDRILLEINKAYTSYQNEQKQYDDNILSLVSQGYNLEDAIKQIEETIIKPLYSEYPTGLAVNFYKDNEEDNKIMYEWLENNAYKYGFILRYPKDKETITGAKYSRSHYRYVGIESAQEMHDKNLCLEEYLNLKG